MQGALRGKVPSGCRLKAEPDLRRANRCTSQTRSAADHDDLLVFDCLSICLPESVSCRIDGSPLLLEPRKVFDARLLTDANVTKLGHDIPRHTRFGGVQVKHTRCAARQHGKVE